MQQKTYLLDTNMVSRIAGEDWAVQSRVQNLGAHESAITCVLVAGEILFGVQRLPEGRRKQLLSRKMLSVLGEFESVGVPEAAQHTYATLRCRMERAGTPMAEVDLWIAATALALGATLVTADSDFYRNAGVPVEDWSVPLST